MMLDWIFVASAGRHPKVRVSRGTDYYVSKYGLCFLLVSVCRVACNEALVIIKGALLGEGCPTSSQAWATVRIFPSCHALQQCFPCKRFLYFLPLLFSLAFSRCAPVRITLHSDLKVDVCIRPWRP